MLSPDDPYAVAAEAVCGPGSFSASRNKLTFPQHGDRLCVEFGIADHVILTFSTKDDEFGESWVERELTLTRDEFSQITKVHEILSASNAASHPNPTNIEATNQTHEGSGVVVRFHPQAWQNDYAIDVDPEGETDWEVSAEHLAKLLRGTTTINQVDDIYTDDTDSSDALRDDPAAPEWVRAWRGPFYVEIRDDNGYWDTRSA